MQEIILKDQVKYLLEWMKQHRAENTGFGAPIIMLKGMLWGEDITQFGNFIAKHESISSHFDSETGKYKESFYIKNQDGTINAFKE